MSKFNKIYEYEYHLFGQVRQHSEILNIFMHLLLLFMLNLLSSVCASILCRMFQLQ